MSLRTVPIYLLEEEFRSSAEKRKQFLAKCRINDDVIEYSPSSDFLNRCKIDPDLRLYKKIGENVRISMTDLLISFPADDSLAHMLRESKRTDCVVAKFLQLIRHYSPIFELHIAAYYLNLKEKTGFDCDFTSILLESPDLVRFLSERGRSELSAILANDLPAKVSDRATLFYNLCSKQVSGDIELFMIDFLIKNNLDLYIPDIIFQRHNLWAIAKLHSLGWKCKAREYEEFVFENGMVNQTARLADRGFLIE